jgi:N-acyl-D-glutamate deacylase
MGCIKRIVRRNDKAVPATIIGGRIAYRDGVFSDDLGKKPFGRFLCAKSA